MSLDSRLAQLSDPNSSERKKRQLYNQLEREASTEQSKPWTSLATGVLGGGLAALAGGAAGRHLVKRNVASAADNPVAQKALQGAYLTAVANPFPGIRKATQRMVNDVDPSAAVKNSDFFKRGKDDPNFFSDVMGSTKSIGDNPAIMQRLGSDIGAATGAGLGFTAYAGLSQPITDPITKEIVRASPESLAILDKVKAGTATREDISQFKEYYDKVQGGKGSNWGQYAAMLATIAGAGLLVGGKTTHRLGNRLGFKPGEKEFFATEGGRDVAIEKGLNSVIAGGLGGLAGSTAYNATSDPYTDPL